MKGGKAGQASAHYGRAADLLLKSAYELVSENGLSPLTIRAVADGAGVSPMAYKSHYPNGRPDLVVATAELATKRLVEHLRPISAGHTGDQLDTVQAFARAYVEWASAHPHLYLAIFSSDVAISAKKASERFQDQLDERRGELLGLLDELFALCDANNGERWAWAAMLHGFATTEAETPDPFWPDALEEAVTALTYRIRQSL